MSDTVSTQKNDVLIHHQCLHFDNVNDSYTLTFELMVSTTSIMYFRYLILRCGNH